MTKKFTCSMQKKKESFAKKSGYRPSYYDHSLIMAITYKGSTIYCGAEDGDMWSNDIEDAYVWNSFDTISTIAVENFVDVAKEALETRWISEDNVEYLPAPIDTYESKKSEGATGIGDTMYASKLKSLARKLGSFGFKVSDTVEVKDENANDKSAEYNLSAKKDGKSYKINVDIYEGKHTTITLRDGATNAYISHLGEGSSFASAVSAIDADSVKSESKKSEGVGGKIKMGIDYNMFMRMCASAAYLDNDEDYWDALWEYYSEMGEIEDACEFFDNLFQYTSWCDEDEVYDEYLDDSYKDGTKSKAECIEAAVDAGDLDVFKTDKGYLVIQ